MGKIKGKLIKRTANNFSKQGLGFTKEFDHNKKILGTTMPSKKIRNQIAGYLVRVKRNEEKNKLVIKSE